MATSPEFSKKTVDTLAKRSAYVCSNPDCRVKTVGPNSNPEKATVIGEAAHIYGARPGSMRYDSRMSDAFRSEITNAIWLCRNCHKIIDSDESKYFSDLLFEWRETHEEYALSELGGLADRVEKKCKKSMTMEFDDYPPVVRRIVLDKPDGWEYRLTSELMRNLNAPYFRRLKDLREGLCIKERKHLKDSEVVEWVRERLSDSSYMATSFVPLIDRLTASWGAVGEPGDASEIHHVCRLIRDNLFEVVKFEENASFVNVSERYECLVSLIQDVLGSQVEKLESIPIELDDFLSFMDEVEKGGGHFPSVIKKEIVFEVPVGWEKRVTKEIKRVVRYEVGNSNGEHGDSGLGWMWVLLILVILIFFVF